VRSGLVGKEVFLIVEKADFFLIQEPLKPIPDGFAFRGDLALIVEENANAAVVEKISFKCSRISTVWMSIAIFLF